MNRDKDYDFEAGKHMQRTSVALREAANTCGQSISQSIDQSILAQEIVNSILFSQCKVITRNMPSAPLTHHSASPRSLS